MLMGVIKNIVFDFGGVLYDINIPLTFNKLKSLSDAPKCFENGTSDSFSQITTNYESGNITTIEFLEAVKSNLQISADYSEIIDAWNALLISPFNDAYDVIKKLSKKFNLYLLSNTNELHFNHFYPQVKDIFNFFNKYYLSFEIGFVKPDENIFNFIINDSLINKNETLFIDDSEINVISAQKIGFQTIHYINLKLSDILHTI